MSHSMLRMTALTILGGVATLGSPLQSVYAAPSSHQMPFPCNQTWRSQTRSNHSPQLASDLNRGSSASADLGDTVVASANGTVRTSHYSTTTGYGNYIVIDHGGGWTSHYAHLRSRSVGAGNRVNRGQKIGEVGNTTNRPPMSPHLHFEQRLNNSLQRITWNGSGIYYFNGSSQTTSYTSKNCGGGGGGPSDHKHGTIKTSGGALRVRSAPNTNSSVVGSVANGSQVDLFCYRRGQKVTGTYGTSDIWNKISKNSNQFVADVYVYTGSDNPIVPACK